MKHLLLILAFFTMNASATPKHIHHANNLHEKAQTYVYICNSSSAYAYHSDINCRGLARCTHGVSKVTLEEAQRMGRKPCHICY